jgi:diamine N-acetyltransferase
MESRAQISDVYIEELSSVVIDLNIYITWLRDIRNNSFIEGVRLDYSISELEQYLEEKFRKPDVRFWGIFLSSGEFIGTIKLEPIDFVQGSAWLGILIGSTTNRGKGYGAQAIQKVSTYALTELKLKVLYLGVNVDNVGAFELYKKLGFKVFDIRGKSISMKKLLQPE